MQTASTALAPVLLSDHSVVASRSDGGCFSEANPVDLVAYTHRVDRSGIDILYYPSDTAAYSGYSQNGDSPTRFNCPIDLAVSSPRGQSQRSELASSNDPVNLAAYARKQPEYGALPSNLSANEMSDVSVRSNGDGNQPLAELPPNAVQTVSGDVKDRAADTSSAPALPPHQNNALIRSLAAASSALTQQTAKAYTHGFGLTNAATSSYHSAQWRPVLSARTAQLMASAVTSSGQPLHADGIQKEAGTQKEGECNPLLLQLQTAQLQALLRGLPPTSTVQYQSAAAPAQRRQFACNMCGKTLSSQHNLRLHETTIHRGLFQFHCPICNKGLRQQRDLRGHLANRHDWKKEFRCSICGHEFGYKRNLKHHVMSHHGRSSLDE